MKQEIIDALCVLTELHVTLPRKEANALYVLMVAVQAGAHECTPLTEEQAKRLIKNSDLLDMYRNIGWYSAPESGFVKHGLSLIRDVEAAHGIKEQP